MFLQLQSHFSLGHICSFIWTFCSLFQICFHSSIYIWHFIVYLNIYCTICTLFLHEHLMFYKFKACLLLKRKHIRFFLLLFLKSGNAKRTSSVHELGSNLKTVEILSIVLEFKVDKVSLEVFLNINDMTSDDQRYRLVIHIKNKLKGNSPNAASYRKIKQPLNLHFG